MIVAPAPDSSKRVEKREFPRESLEPDSSKKGVSRESLEPHSSIMISVNLQLIVCSVEQFIYVPLLTIDIEQYSKIYLGLKHSISFLVLM